MINERDIAAKFSSVWTQVFPMLTPNFMREFNASWIEEFAKNQKVNPVGHSDVVSEFAFQLSRQAFERNTSLEELSREIIKNAFEYSTYTISRNIKTFDLPNQLSQKEILEARLLAQNILDFVNFWKPKSVRFAPTLPGYGVIAECSADIAIDDTLFEIKTVTRTFRAKDLKQLILYLALQSASGERKWKYAGLFNPRLGVYSKFTIDNFVKNLSGYESPQHAFRELLDLFVRDVQFDSNF